MKNLIPIVVELTAKAGGRGARRLEDGFNEMALRHFVEEVALVFEQAGLPRMAARLFGYLMISDPPHQNSAQPYGGR